MNDNDNSLARVVCVIGPTGSGKNDLALWLSKKFPLEIINFDSRQVYSDLPIITAQPSESEKHSCPHHLYGFLGLRDRISAGAFMDRARQTIADVAGRGRIPFLVGGTGLYLRSLIYGLVHIPAVPEAIQAELESELRRSGVQVLYQRLISVDPVYSGSITGNDRQKIIRALGVYMTTGKPFSEWHREQNREPFYRALKLGIIRELEELTPGLKQRITKMIRAGAVEEVKKAWEKSGCDPFCPAFSGIGCAEVIGYIEGETDLEQAVDLWMKNTRAYAKRQLTWFRKEQDISWVRLDEKDRVLNLANEFLGR